MSVPFLLRCCSVSRGVHTFFFLATTNDPVIQCTEPWQNWVNIHACMQQCHSAFVTAQLHLYKYCVSGSIYEHKGAFVLGGCCVFVCGSTGLLFVEAVLDYYCRKRQLGMCLDSVGSGLALCQTHRWPESQSLFFLWLSCSVRSQTPSLFSTLLSLMKTFPLVNRERKTGVGDMTESQKNMSLCGRGMLLMGVNMLLKRRGKHRWH